MLENSRSIRRAWPSLLFFCWTVFVFGAEEKISKTFQVGPGGTLTLEADVGSVVVKSGGDAVQIDVILRKPSWDKEDMERFLERFNVDFRQTGNSVTVRAEYDDRHHGWFRSGSRTPEVRFEITVPAVYNLDLETSGGSVSVGDVAGSVKSNTSGGSLDFGRIKGPVQGTTSGGSIRVEQCEGNLSLETSGGGIRVDSVKGDVVAETSGGSITLEDVEGTVQAGTSGGSIHAAFGKCPEKDCRLETSGGSITVIAPEELKADLDASTSGGRVSTEFPVTVSGEIRPEEIRAALNGGGPLLLLRTSGGNIRIEKSKR